MMLLHIVSSSQQVRKLADVKIGGISIDFDSLDPRVKSLVIDREGNQTQKGMLMFKEALKHHHLTAYSPVCAIPMPLQMRRLRARIFRKAQEKLCLKGPRLISVK